MEFWPNIIKELMEFMGIYVLINALKQHLLIVQVIYVSDIVIQAVPYAVHQKTIKHALDAILVQPSFQQILDVI